MDHESDDDLFVGDLCASLMDVLSDELKNVDKEFRLSKPESKPVNNNIMTMIISNSGGPSDAKPQTNLSESTIKNDISGAISPVKSGLQGQQNIVTNGLSKMNVSKLPPFNSNISKTQSPVRSNELSKKEMNNSDDSSDSSDDDDNGGKEDGQALIVDTNSKPQASAENQNSKQEKPPENAKEKKPRERRERKKKGIKYPAAAAKLFTEFRVVRDVVCTLMKLCNDEVQMDRSAMLCRDIERMNNSYKTYINGSRALGMTDRNGDLDIFLDVDGMFHGDTNQEQEVQAKLVRKTSRLFYRDRATWCNVFALTDTRTPIIKAFHIPSGLDCDISFKNGLGAINTHFIKTMIGRVPVLRPLIIMLKFWIKAAKLENHIRSYFLSIMVVFYLQVENCLPSLAKMRDGCGIKKISGWEVQFSDSPVVFQDVKPVPNFVQLLHGFFKYYGSVFKYNEEVVCPLLGRTILKKDFDNGATKLPDEMRMYKEMVSQHTSEERRQSKISPHLVSDPTMELFRNKSHMCVQDPFDLSHNLTKAVSPNTLNKFRTFCLTEAEKTNKMLSSMNWLTYNNDFWK